MFINFLLVLISTFVFLIVFDFCLRIIYPLSDLYLPHEAYDYGLKPNKKINFSKKEFATTIKINRLGLRDEEFALEKESNCRRIVVLGDSFVFGHGVNLEDTFVKQLERGLNQITDKKIQVINGGINGYDTKREFFYLREKLIHLQPEMIIIAFTLNDPFSNSGEYHFSPLPENPLLRKMPFHALGFFWQYSQNIKKSLKKAGFKVDYQSFNHLKIFEQAEDQKTKEAWQATFVYLEKIKELADENNAQLVIFNVPTARELYCPDSFAFDKEIVCEENHNYNKVTDNLSSFAAKERALFISLINKFRQETGPLYYPEDGHWNKKAHSLAAEVIQQGLVEKNSLFQ